MTKADPQIIPCAANSLNAELIDTYVQALIEAAPSIGNHGMTPSQFKSSGLFQSAIEKIRGSQAAMMKDKNAFFTWALDHLKDAFLISDYTFTGPKDRHDYSVVMPDGRQSIFEAKGCLDGNNTTIWERPPNAEEFIIWSLCKNPGSNMAKGVWSGCHTRLGGKMVAERAQCDALIVWDMLCCSGDRVCPKTLDGRGVEINGVLVPPPCIYLFPRTIPDARNNPKPTVWKIKEVKLAQALLESFGGDERDVTEVHIECIMDKAEVYRTTSFVRAGKVVKTSRSTHLKRAR